MFGPWTIRELTALKCGQAVRTDGPQTHPLVKNGTPTMGDFADSDRHYRVHALLWGLWANPYVTDSLGRTACYAVRSVLRRLAQSRL